MSKHPKVERPVRNSVILDAAMWAEIEAERRAAPGEVPSKMEMVRRLLREALDARAAGNSAVSSP